VATTAKTYPGFVDDWTAMLTAASGVAAPRGVAG
jgi:hypothetical protein